MKIAVTFLIAAFASSPGWASLSPEAPAQIIDQGDSMVLTSGRSFGSYIIKRQTASSVFIISDGSVVKVDKRLLPGDLRVKFPIDEAAIAVEARELAEADRVMKLRIAEQEAKRKKEYDLRIAKAAETEKYKKRLVEFQDLGEQKRNTHEGLALMVVDPGDNSHSAIVTMKNVTDGPIVFNWHDLQAEFVWGAKPDEKGNLAPSEISPADDAHLVLRPGESKKFQVQFNPQSGAGMGMFMWNPGVWHGRNDPNFRRGELIIADPSLLPPPRG